MAMRHFELRKRRSTIDWRLELGFATAVVKREVDDCTVAEEQAHDRMARLVDRRAPPRRLGHREPPLADLGQDVLETDRAPRAPRCPPGSAHEGLDIGSGLAARGECKW
jgi:hypothetical protein